MSARQPKIREPARFSATLKLVTKSSEKRRQTDLGAFTLHFPGVLVSLGLGPLTVHFRLPPSKCFSVNAGASPGSFVLGEFRRCLTI